MKKALFALVMVIAFSLLAGCVVEPKAESNKEVSNNLSEAVSLITTQQAVSIVKEKIGDNNGSRIIEYDQTETLNNREYYIVHAYSVGPPDDEGIQLSYTYGWYYVDATTGKPYKYNPANLDDGLIPLE